MSIDKRHLAEERLWTCYLTEGAAGGGRLDTEARAHLARCERCARRYEELGLQAETLRAADAAGCDALFTPEHLEAQRAHILRRLEGLGRPARVLRFPAPTARHLSTADRAHPAMRWVAAAAVAGLFVGLSLGWLMDVHVGMPFSSARPAAITTLRQPGQSMVAVTSARAQETDADEAFLNEIERAVATQRAAELEALDALTPHVREVAAPAR